MADERNQKTNRENSNNQNVEFLFRERTFDFRKRKARFGEMRGIVTTIHKHGAMLVPVATPIVYAKRDAFDGSLGDITAANPLYATYKKALEETTSDGYARLIDP